MATVALTDRLIRSLSVEQGVEDFRDSTFRGFGIRVTAGGTKSFFVIYAFGGRRRRYHLGLYPTVSLARAKKKARGILVRVDNGEDPQAERAAKRKADTFADLCKLFLELYARPRHSQAWLKYEERIIAKEQPGCRYTQTR